MIYTKIFFVSQNSPNTKQQEQNHIRWSLASLGRYKMANRGSSHRSMVYKEEKWFLSSSIQKDKPDGYLEKNIGNNTLIVHKN